MHPDEHEKWNESMAARFDPDAFITRSGWPVRWVERQRLHKTVSALKIPSDGVVLDLGCGPGNLTALIQARKIVAVDLSDTLLAQARERLKSKSNVEIKKCAAETLSFPDNTFDGIVCSEVLEHVRDPRKVADEMFRVAKPNSLAVVSIPDEGHINFTKKLVLALGLKKWVAGRYNMSDNMLDEWHVTEMSADRLSAIFDQRFERVRQFGVPFAFWPYHHVFVFRIRK